MHEFQFRRQFLYSSPTQNLVLGKSQTGLAVAVPMRISAAKTFTVTLRVADTAVPGQTRQSTVAFILAWGVGAAGKAGETILGMARGGKWKQGNQRQAVFLCHLNNNMMQQAERNREHSVLRNCSYADQNRRRKGRDGCRENAPIGGITDRTPKERLFACLPKRVKCT